MSIEEKIGIKTSIALGLPTGVVAVVFGILFPAATSGEPFFALGYLLINYISILGLLISFPGALWIAGRRLGNDIKLGEKVLPTLLKYSITVNAIIWPVFIILHWLKNDEFDLFFGFYFPICMAIFSILVTPFTIGLVIYWAARKIIERKLASTKQRL